MEPAGRRDDGPAVSPRLLIVYPLVVVAFVAALVIWAPRREVEVAPPDDAPIAATAAPGAPQVLALQGEDEEQGRTLEGLREQGRDATAKVKAAALKVAGVFGERIGLARDLVDEKVDLDQLASGGERAARFAPYVGPYVRYRRARGMYRSDDLELQQRAKCQTVIALAELALDVTSGGLDKAAAGTTGVLDVLEGAVDVADFAGFVLSVHEELGGRFAISRLSAASLEVEQLAGRALEEIEGLDRLAVTLLEIEADPLLASLPPELAERVERLAEGLLPSEPDER